jgi:hypothetical protein
VGQLQITGKVGSHATLMQRVTRLRCKARLPSVEISLLLSRPKAVGYANLAAALLQESV